MKPVVLLDFDGTVTKRDVIDVILETFADPAWREVETAWQQGRIGSRECLTAQMALVNATPRQVDALLETIEIDPGFVPLIGACAAHGVPAQIVSDGFDYCIRRVLAREATGAADLAAIPVVSNRLEYRQGVWRVGFDSYSSCTHRCATCKAAVVDAIASRGGPTIFAGDGLSDRYAAGRADVVFAKGTLAAYCREQAIAHEPFDTLADVVRELDRLIRRRPQAAALQSHG